MGAAAAARFGGMGGGSSDADEGARLNPLAVLVGFMVVTELCHVDFPSFEIAFLANQTNGEAAAVSLLRLQHHHLAGEGRKQIVSVGVRFTVAVAHVGMLGTLEVDGIVELGGTIAFAAPAANVSDAAGMAEVVFDLGADFVNGIARDKVLGKDRAGPAAGDVSMGLKGMAEERVFGGAEGHLHCRGNNQPQGEGADNAPEEESDGIALGNGPVAAGDRPHQISLQPLHGGSNGQRLGQQAAFNKSEGVIKGGAIGREAKVWVIAKELLQLDRGPLRSRIRLNRQPRCPPLPALVLLGEIIGHPLAHAIALGLEFALSGCHGAMLNPQHFALADVAAPLLPELPEIVNIVFKFYPGVLPFIVPPAPVGIGAGGEGGWCGRGVGHGRSVSWGVGGEEGAGCGVWGVGGEEGGRGVGLEEGGGVGLGGVLVKWMVTGLRSPRWRMSMMARWGPR